MTQSTLAKCATKPKAVDRGQALINACRQSGLSQAAYARQHHIGAHLVTYWKASTYTMRTIIGRRRPPGHQHWHPYRPLKAP